MVTVVGIAGSCKAVNFISESIRQGGDVFYDVLSTNDPIVKDADAFVQTNMLKPKFATSDKSGPYEYILQSKKPFLVNESPSFRRYAQITTHKRYGWYSYKWTDGIFGNENSPPDRWNKFQKETNIQLQDWKSPGDKIIIMGQKEGDSSLMPLYENGYTCFREWVQEIVDEIRKYTDREIIVRPHPRNLRAGMKGAHAIKGKNVTVSDNIKIGDIQDGPQGGKGLEADLKQAHCVITFNSLSAVESVCDGIPTFTLDNGSMAWPVGHKDLSQIENLNYNIDRTQWCYDIAYTQWNNKECKSGEAWAHLKPLVFR